MSESEDIAGDCQRHLALPKDACECGNHRSWGSINGQAITGRTSQPGTKLFRFLGSRPFARGIRRPFPRNVIGASKAVEVATQCDPILLGAWEQVTANN
jgi:hypothetical protein